MLLALSAATVAGAWWLSFLCDDAFITFRYVANARDGHGLVWNPAPFAPVEGYSSFAWAMLLWAMWQWAGIAPPDAANWLSIGFGVGQFWLIAWAALRIRNRTGSLVSDGVGLLAVATIVCNRTFLQWMTSGLETAMFNFALIGWVLWAFRQKTTGAGWLFVWSLLATLAAVTRPDGLLFAAVTVAVAGFTLIRGQRSFGNLFVGLLPLLGVAAHVGWRHWFYGEWLPNTYYAKVVASWPEAGMRYLGCFALEHGLWLLPLILLIWLISELVDPRSAVRTVIERPSTFFAVAAIIYHAGYYTFKVGGDHFEYRVYSHLVPLGVLAVCLMAARTTSGSRWTMLAVTSLLLASTLGWGHLYLTRDLPAHGFQTTADKLPAAVAPVTRWYDRQQAWLLFHNIGLRCQHHASILERFSKPFSGAPPEASRKRLRIEEPNGTNPAFAAGAVGVVGWCLPDCAVLDHHGLNDWVVARTPVRSSGPPLNRTTLQPILDQANTNQDPWLDQDEMRAALGLLSDGKRGKDAEVGADFLVRVMLAIHARENSDKLTMQEAQGIGDMLSRARSMAHERHPPEGYIEDFEPNVTIAGGAIEVGERASPLTDERVQQLEKTWRERVLEKR